MEENWKKVQIDCPATDYYVSDLGRCKSVRNGIERTITGKAYANSTVRVVNYRNSEYSIKGFIIAREIYRLFIGRVGPDDVIELKDPDKGFQVSNLRKLTRAEQGHKVAANLILNDGNSTIHSKLTAQQVKAIRKQQYKVKQKDVAEQYGVSPTQIKRIWRGENWKQLATF